MNKTVKTIALAASGILFLGGIAAADAFDTNTVDITVQSGNLAFTQGLVEGDLVDFEVSAIVRDAFIGPYYAMAFAHASYDRTTDEVTLGATVGAERAVSLAQVYAFGEVEYAADAEALAEGEFFLTPTVGIYTNVLSETVVPFAELERTYNISEDFTSAITSLEAGVDLNLSQNLTLTPSVSRDFNDDFEVETTSANLNVVFTF